MKTIAVLAFAVATVGGAVLWAGSSTVPATDPILVNVFQGRYAAMKAAMGARDAKAIAALLAPGFETEDVGGERGSAEAMIQQVVSLKKDPNKVSETKIQSVLVKGKKAVVTQRYNMTTSKTGPDGKRQSAELVTVSTDTWVNVDGQWLLRKTLTNQLDYTMGGKVLAHKIHQTQAAGQRKP